MRGDGYHYDGPPSDDEITSEMDDEINQSMKEQGVTPEDLPDPDDRKAYAAWLEAHKDDGGVGIHSASRKPLSDRLDTNRDKQKRGERQ